MFRNAQLSASLNAWRLRQIPPLSASDAIEKLLQRALMAENSLVQPAPRADDDKVTALAEQMKTAWENISREAGRSRDVA